MNKKGEKDKNMRNKGITLIALVITIIVLLILAAVSIATLTGENGILTRAQDAKTNTEIAEEKEAIGIAYNGVMTDNLGTGVEAKALENELRSNGYTNATAVDNGDGTITVTFESGRSYTIDADGNISDPEEVKIIAAMKVEGTKVETPNLPSDEFCFVGGTVDEGIVISDNKADDGKGVNSDELIGNQYVWIPVEQNQKLKISVKTEENIESIKLTTPYGEEQELEKIDYQEINLTGNENYINGVYKLTVTAVGETKEIELDVYSLYAQRMWELDLFTDEVAKELGYENAEDYFNNSMYGESGMSLEQLIDMIPTLYKSSYKDMVIKTDSVNANGGFYIGRYEASEEAGKVATKKDKKPWNNISQEQALENTKTETMYPDSDFTSTLLTGAAWDRTLCWLYETGEKSIVEIVGDSKSWGNYSDDEDGNNGIVNTGSARTIANNIYDLAGNLSEWTTEANYTTLRVYRGGDYGSSGSNIPASSRYDFSPSDGYGRIGFRPALFL